MTRFAAPLAVGWLLLVAAAALAGPWLPFDPGALDVAHRLAPSSLRHPLGTDQLGRDLALMLVAGAAPALRAALLATLLGAGGGIPLGLLAALGPGWLDDLLARAGDALFAVPALMVALLLVAVLGPGTGPVALAVGLAFVPVFLRVTRAGARTLAARDFVAAARLAGRGGAGIAWAHLLPNLRALLLAQAATQFSLALLAEAALAFLGVGVQPPTASWGRMVADAQTLVAVAPRLVLLPGAAILLTVLAATALADRLGARVPR